MENSQSPQKVTELLVEDIVVGSGTEVKSGSKVRAHYLGMFLDGTKFQSSYDFGQPFEATIGVGQLIAGWDKGIPGMKAGGKRRLTIPSELAYGEYGTHGIPGNSDLIFEVEVLEVL